jgi:hypothetical protein
MSKQPNIHVAAEWGPRRATVDECGALVSRSFQLLSALSVNLSGWRKVGSKGPVLDLRDSEAIKKLLLSGRNRRDIDKSVISELGFLVTVWNGNLTAEAQCTIKCGGYSTVGGLRNRVLVRLDFSLAAQLGADGLAKALGDLIDLWGADSGAVFSLDDSTGAVTRRMLFEYEPSTSASSGPDRMQSAANFGRARIRAHAFAHELLGLG